MRNISYMSVFLSLALFAVSCCCLSAPLEPADSPDPDLTRLRDELSIIQSPEKVDTSADHYVVKKGDTLWRIAAVFNVHLDDLLSENNISNVKDLKVGSRLSIPVKSYAPEIKNPVVEFSAPVNMHVSPRGYIWPVSGRVRKDDFKSGIIIHASCGSDVRAVKDGMVVFVSESLQGYGKTLIIRHSDDMYSLYGYNSGLLVEKGSRVRQGDPVARVGVSPKDSLSGLYFRMIANRGAVNPYNYLPRE